MQRKMGRGPVRETVVQIRLPVVRAIGVPRFEIIEKDNAAAPDRERPRVFQCKNSPDP